MASNLSRKALKQDKFAVEVEHTVDFFAAHRPQVIRYGGAALAIVLIVGVVWFFRSSQRSARQQVLGEAMSLFTAPVGTPNPSGPTFNSEAAKNDAVTRAFTKITSDYAGSEEAYIAEFYLASQDTESGKLDDARKKYQDVIAHANANDASLAKLALAQIDLGNHDADARTLLKDLMDHPTDLVSKDQATIAYAQAIGPTQPDEARKLLLSVAGAGNPDVTSIATAALNSLPQK